MRPLYLGSHRAAQAVHVLDVDLVLVEADGVVAEFFGDAVALAVDLGRGIHGDLGIHVGEGQLIFGERLEQSFLDSARDVDRVDDHDVPVARLGLLDDGEAGAGAFELLEVDLDPVGVLEGFQQGRIGVVAPDQGVELLGDHRRGSKAADGQCEESRESFSDRPVLRHVDFSPGFCSAKE